LILPCKSANYLQICKVKSFKKLKLYGTPTLNIENCLYKHRSNGCSPISPRLLPKIPYFKRLFRNYAHFFYRNNETYANQINNFSALLPFAARNMGTKGQKMGCK
jgi:hypothetical protein